MSFVATFAPAALVPVIREDLFLTKSQLGNAGVAAVCGAIAARLGMGAFVDTVGECGMSGGRRDQRYALGLPLSPHVSASMTTL
jgi:hypothetical protein